MSVSATSDPRFPMANKLFPDSYYGQADEPVDHKLPIFSKGDSFSFKDIIDTINPLQHIPVVSAIYRKVTGDEPGAVGRLAGAALYGGPVGLVTEEINCAIADKTGDDISGHAVTLAASAFSDQTDATAQANTSTPAAAAAAPSPAPAQATASTQEPPSEPPTPAAAPQPDVAKTAEKPVALALAADSGNSGQPTQNSAAVDTPKPMPLQQHQHFMPVPARRSADSMARPQMVNLPVSTSGERSNVPLTGYQPHTYAAVNAAAVRNILAETPTVPPTPTPTAAPSPTATPTPTPAPAPAASAAAPAAGTQAGTDSGTANGNQTWFSAALMAGMNKYEKMKKPSDQNGDTAAP